jgi:hypothetical protein
LTSQVLGLHMCLLPCLTLTDVFILLIPCQKIYGFIWNLFLSHMIATCNLTNRYVLIWVDISLGKSSYNWLWMAQGVLTLSKTEKHVEAHFWHCLQSVPCLSSLSSLIFILDLYPMS